VNRTLLTHSGLIVGIGAAPAIAAANGGAVIRRAARGKARAARSRTSVKQP